MREFGPHRPARNFLEQFRELWSYREVIFNIAATQIHAQYRGSFLGLFWTVLGPLAMLAVYTAVFGHLIGRNIEHYALYLISGMVPFLAFQQSSVGGCRSFIVGEVYLRRVYLPKLLFPTVTLSVQFFGFLCTLAAVLALTPFLDARLSVHWLALLPAIGLLFVFNYGVIMLLAVVNVYLPDLEHVINAGLRALYFLTPVIYKSGPPLPQEVILINTYNPLTHLLVLFRAPLYHNVWATPTEWLTAALIALAAFVIGAMVLRLNQHKLIYAM
jgi:ABC-type polysaccharide/polyol phosphate export permease